MMHAHTPNSPRLRMVLIGAGLIFLAVAKCQATLVATDFNVAGTDTGFSGSWAGSSYVNVETVNSDLTFANYYISQTGTSERVVSIDIATDRQKKRDLATPLSGNIWFSALMHVPTDGDMTVLTFNNYDTNFDPSETTLRILLQGGVLKVGFNGGALSSGTGGFAADTTHLVLGQMTVGVGNDSLDIWVDPDLTSVNSPGGLPAADFSSTTTDFGNSITNIGVGGNKGTAAEVYLDAIWLSDGANAFSDVTGVSSGVQLSNNSISSNSPPGTLVGQLSWLGSGTADGYDIDQSQGDYSYFDIANGSTNLRTTTWLDKAAFSLFVVASSNSVVLTTNELTVTATESDPIFIVDTEVQIGTTNGTTIGTAEANDSNASFSIIAGRDDLFYLDGASLKLTNSASWSGINTTNYVTLQATAGGRASELIVEAVVISGPTQGTIFKFR